MELDYLREFVALAKTCQFQETAEQLFISQSSLSKHIKVIEKELGAELLNRSTRRVELSEFGRAFLPYAAAIAETQREYTLTLLSELNDQDKKITIGAIPLVTFYKLNRFLSHFSGKYPSYSVEIVEHNGITLREMLRKGECDLIIVCGAPDGSDSAEFNAARYTEDTLVAVVPEGHPLATQDAVSAVQLAANPLIQLGKLNLAHFIDPDIPPAALTVSRGPLLMSSVLRGMGVGILTRHAADFFMMPGLVSVPVSPETRVQLDLLYPKKRRKNSFAVQTILDYVHMREEELTAEGQSGELP